MYLYGVDVNGFDTVVIQNNDAPTIVFRKRCDKRWEREGKPTDVVEHIQIVNKIKKFACSPWHDVSVSGTFVNIRPWDRK